MDLEIEKIRNKYRDSEGSGGFVNPANMNHYTDWLEQQLKNCNLQNVSNNEVKLKALLEKLLEENMCSVVGDELIEYALKSL